MKKRLSKTPKIKLINEFKNFSRKNSGSKKISPIKKLFSNSPNKTNLNVTDKHSKKPLLSTPQRRKSNFIKFTHFLEKVTGTEITQKSRRYIERVDGVDVNIKIVKNPNLMKSSPPKKKPKLRNKSKKMETLKTNNRIKLPEASHSYLAVIKKFCFSLSVNIYYLYKYLESSYSKVSKFLDKLIKDIGANLQLLKDVFLADQNLAVGVDFLNP